MTIYEFVETIKTKADFDKFLFMLYEDFEVNGQGWENNTLKLYLETLSQYSKDIPGYYQNMNEQVDLERPSWKMFAHILLGATIYE